MLSPISVRWTFCNSAFEMPSAINKPGIENWRKAFLHSRGKNIDLPSKNTEPQFTSL